MIVDRDHRRASDPFAFCVVVLCLTAIGCGPVRVTGGFDGQPFSVTGSAVAWVDKSQYRFEGGSQTAKLATRSVDDSVLFVQFYEAVFDPSVDLFSLPPADQTRIRDEMQRGDHLLWQVRRGAAVRDGDRLRAVATDQLPPEVFPYIDVVDVQFGARDVSGNAKYPQFAPRLAGNQKVNITLTQTSPDLVGQVALSAKRTATESDGFVEGKVVVDFTIPLLAERVAECNFDRSRAGVVDACTLAPLSGQ